MNIIDTGLTCTNGNPIFVGEKFYVNKHIYSECCNHEIICEVRKDEKCRSGYGLYEVKTNKFIVNADMACYRVD